MCIPRRRRVEQRLPALLCCVVVTVFQLSSVASGFRLPFGKKHRQRQEAEALARRLAEEAAAQRQQMFLAGGVATLCVLLLGSLYVYLKVFSSAPSEAEDSPGQRGNRPTSTGEETIDVVVIGTGVPKKGMGWYHLTQLLEMTNVNVRAVVEEPLYSSRQDSEDGKATSSPQALVDFLGELTSLGVEVLSSEEELPTRFDRPTICVICTLDAQENVSQAKKCLKRGNCQAIYMDPPTAIADSSKAPDLALLEEELRATRAMSSRLRVPVYVGFPKNVTCYVQKALTLSRQIEGSHVFFCHNNSYEQKDLPMVFSRQPGGLLHHMALHELALMVTFFGITVETILHFKVNPGKLFTEQLTIWKPGTSMPTPEYLTDFSRCAFKITSARKQAVSVMCDRRGGTVSFAVVKDENGIEVRKFEFPNDEWMQQVQPQMEADPDMNPDFLLYSSDYMELKKRVVRHALKEGNQSGKNGAGANGHHRTGSSSAAATSTAAAASSFEIGGIRDVATVDTALEAVRLAKHCKKEIKAALRAAG